jgi:transcriptional regulator with XRE-family HTH domain
MISGSNIGIEMRALRSRTNMKQSTLAERLGVSQAFVSRLESGTLKPNPMVIRRIQEIMADPTVRSVGQYILEQVRRSPDIRCIVRPGRRNVRYVALSKGFRAHPQHEGLKEGDQPRVGEIDRGSDMMLHLLNCGLLSGEVESVDALWSVESNGEMNHWRAVVTPMRCCVDGWCLHCSMVFMQAQAYRDLMANRSNPLVITRVH